MPEPQPGRDDSTGPVRLALPKGRIYEGVAGVLGEAGIRVRTTSRDYRPDIGLPAFETKILKARAVVEMLDAGSRDLGFAGADWVAETGAEVVEMLDLGLDPVRIVAAAPSAMLDAQGRLPTRPLVVASEYTRLATAWIRDNKLDATLLTSYGATEVLPPEDADCIIDNTATGATLAANNLTIIDELMTSTTRLYASVRALESPSKRDAIERFTMLVRSVLEARRRVMIELNVPSDRLDALVDVLPCMREPTIARLHHEAGYAVKAAVLRSELPSVIPAVRAQGGTDIVVTTPGQIVL